MFLVPLKKLFYSRKFMLLCLDTIVSVLLHFFGAFENVEFLIGALQPVFVALILAVAYEDAAEKSAP